MTTDRPRSETVGWTPFVSAAYGYSAAVPPDWRVTFGIEPNTVDRFADGESLDAFTGQHGEGSIRAWSVGLSDGPSVDDWITTYLRQADPESACFPSRERWTSIVVGGHAGFVYPGCGSWREAMIPLDTRVYMVSTSVFDDHDPQASGPTADQQSEALLRAFLSTLAFQPEAAMPSSHETVVFTSPQYGYSVAVAAGWLTAAATTPWSAGERIGRGLPTVDTFRLSGTTPMQVYVAARPIAPGTTLDAWIASMAGTREELGGRCFYQTNGWEGTDANDQSLTVAGVEAKRRPMTCGRAAFGVEDWEQYAFVANGRGYAIAGTASMVRLVAGSFTLP
jgi:hypothetical protein